MNRTKDDNYEQGYYTGFCQYAINSELKPGKSESLEPFTQPRTPELDRADSDRRRLGLCPSTAKSGGS